MSSTTEVREALDPITSALRHDGYELEVVDAAERLSLRVVALDGACEDCLVPEDVMATTVSTVLEGRYEPAQISVEYPAAGR